MSDQGSNKENISLEDIVIYLEKHPNFFYENPHILEQVNLNHNQPKGSISLIEHQVSLLRDQNANYKNKLADLISIGKKNDLFIKKIQKLYFNQLKTNNLSERLELINSFLHNDFSIASSVLMISDDLRKKNLTTKSNKFIKYFNREDKKLDYFSKFIDLGSPKCGEIKAEHATYLFGSDPIIRSAALIPVGDQIMLGFLAIGSMEKDYFNPNQSVDILSGLGDLIYIIISNFIDSNE
ncbi:MAG: DUF484 family protein [Pseudomonadota bacterium]|nr:hypothetical protein [Gammaproteobacteria bacterium]MEE2684234.1 DUF484 family protein [Pseudomonadota bacterium]|tara:strand:+ start:159 stop:872 length:714 start_codon:yes stop_codon:yes gene_type:complete